MSLVHIRHPVLEDALSDEIDLVTRGIAENSFESSQGNHSSTNSTWDINIPYGLILDRTMFFAIDVNVFYTSDANGDFTLNRRAIDTMITPAQLGLHRAMQSLQVNLNNMSSSTNPSTLTPLNRYNINDENRELFSGTGSYPSAYAHNAVEVINRSSLKSPLNVDNPDSNTCVVKKIIKSAGNATSPTVYTITFTLIEPIQSPLLSQSDEYSALPHVENLKIKINWNPLEGIFYSKLPAEVYAGAPLALVTTFNPGNVTFGGDTTAKILYHTFSSSEQIPPVVSKAYHEYQSYNSTVELFTAAAPTKDVHSSSFNLSVVPSRIFVYGIPMAPPGANRSDNMLAINTLSVKIAAQSGLMTNSNTYQLYHMSKKNGYNGSYNDFNKRCGSVVCINLEKGDIGSFISSSQTTFNCQFTINATNISLNNDESAVQDTNFIIYYVFELEGKLFLSQGRAVPSIGMSPAMVDEGLSTQLIPYHGALDAQGMKSAGSFRSFKRFIKKHVTVDGVGKAARFASNAMASVPQLQGVSKGLGTAASLTGNGPRMLTQRR